MAPILFFILPIIGIIIAIIFVALILILFFKVFLMYLADSDTAKSGWKPKFLFRDILICATLYAVGRAVFFPYIPPKSSQEIFAEEMGVQAPPSLVLSNWETTTEPTGQHSWMHFQISSSDLKTLLKSGKYIEEKDATILLRKEGCPSWWLSHGTRGVRVYGHKSNSSSSTDECWFRYILFNPQDKDAYFDYQYTDLSW